ncbi:MAG: hypothetical protein ACK5OC_29685, partial [Pirellula sp.]
MRIFVCVLSLLALLPLGGCGGSEDGRLPTYKVSGTVKYKGKLLENARDFTIRSASQDELWANELCRG